MKVKARIIKTAAFVYAGMGDSTPSYELPIGQEIEMCSTHRKGGRTWVLIRPPNGTVGYISGDAHVFVIKQAFLDQDIEVYSDASKLSSTQTLLKKGKRFYIVELIKREEESWRKVRLLEDGKEGFIDGRITLTYEPAPLDVDDITKTQQQVGKNVRHRRSPSTPLTKSSQYGLLIILLLVLGMLSGLAVHEYRTPPTSADVPPPKLPQDNYMLKAWDEGRGPGLSSGTKEQDVINLLGSPDEIIWPGQDHIGEKLQPGEKYLVYGHHALKISNGLTSGEYKVTTVYR